MRNRNWRREQRERKIAAAEAWAKAYWHGDEQGLKEHARQRAITPQACSRYCCGNPRKWFGEPTLQEKRARDAWKEE